MRNFFAARTCTRVYAEESKSHALEELRGHDAYVLLGSPGSGKTEAFRHEAEKESGRYVTARDFIALNQPEWCDTTLFIDGLDEVRAWAADGRQPFDDIRTKLGRLNRPRFRLSCRTVDWYGENDSTNLESVAPNGTVSVFQLDPLSDDAIRECLERSTEIDDVEKFWREAETKGVNFLLNNPLSLNMLAKLVEGGIWPETRTELFDKTIRRLSKESNQEHAIAYDAVDRNAVVGAAEELCAVMLLSGIGGYSHTHRDSNPSDCPGLDEIPGEARALLKHALATGLFMENNNCAVPIHVQVAEFLAGRHLAKLIDRGLPLKRILALMTDDSGAIAVGLRGLAAWLAVHSESSRSELIVQDPFGVALDGDTRSFSRDEKTRLLEYLRRVADKYLWFRILEQADSMGGIQTIPELGDLAMPAMEEQLQECLEDLRPDNNADTSFAWILLEVIRHGAVRRGLAGPVMNIIRNSQWQSVIRERALDVYLQLWRDNGAAPSDLLTLLKAVDSEQIADPDDQLVGRLLEELFPDVLSAPEVLRYLRKPKVPNYIGKYVNFWAYKILEQSKLDLLTELLDAFVDQYERMRNEIEANPDSNCLLRGFPAAILAQFLKKKPEQIASPRLFAWLGAAAWDGDWDYARQSEPGIAEWLERHPKEYKKLLAMGWEYCVQQSECTDLTGFNRHLYMVERRFFGAALSQEDMGHWHLDQSLATTNQIVQEHLIREVAYVVYSCRGGVNFTAEVVKKKISHNTSLLEKFCAWLNSCEALANNLHHGKDQELSEREKHQITWGQERYEKIKQHEDALKRGRCVPKLLHNLARAYLGEFSDISGPNPLTRLRRLLKNDSILIEAVLCGLHRSIERDDLPDVAEIIRLGAGNRRHYLALPFLIGFEEATRLSPSGSVALNPDHIRRALAIHYARQVSRPNGGNPAWYKEVVTKQPQVVAGILIQSVKSDLRSQRDCRENLAALAFSADHAAIARLVALPLLRSFRPRAAADQFPSLRILLFAAILWSDQNRFLRLIERKLGLSSMTVAQRTCWLAAGLCAAPETYGKKFKTHVAKNSRQLQQVVEFMATAPRNVLERCKTESLPDLIQMLGPACPPWFRVIDDSDEGQWTTSAMEAALRIDSWIKRLAADTSGKVTRKLEKLSSDHDLRAWKNLLEDAWHQQKELSRKVNFRHPTIKQVVDTLQSKQPANAADLAALTFDKLTEIGCRIRDGSPAEWRQYWNLDSRRKPQKPRHENDCRDTLLSHLKTPLQQLGIDAQPEGNYADDKRSDIRVSYDNDSFNVPVEIKKSSHRDLWTAIKQQLIEQYTRHPGADGYGIYLVFWLGKKRCQLPSSGIRPENAEELQRQLRSTLTEEQSRKISICVLDIEPS